MKAESRTFFEIERMNVHLHIWKKVNEYLLTLFGLNE